MQNVSGLSFGSNVGTGVESALAEADEKTVALVAAERVSGWITSFKDFMSIASECSSEEEIEFRLELTCQRFPESDDVKVYSARCRNLLEEKLWRNVENAYVMSFVKDCLPAYYGLAHADEGWRCNWSTLSPVLAFISRKAPFVAGEIASRIMKRFAKIRAGLITISRGNNLPPVVNELQQLEKLLLNFTVWRS